MANANVSEDFDHSFPDTDSSVLQKKKKNDYHRFELSVLDLLFP